MSIIPDETDWPKIHHLNVVHPEGHSGKIVASRYRRGDTVVVYDDLGDARNYRSFSDFVRDGWRAA